MRRSFLLIGHRATGKSTLGRALAARRGLPFVDLDERIASLHNRSIDEMLGEDEAAFRRAEITVLDSLLAEDAPVVIAAGGGLERVPHGVFVVWVSRDGWEEDAIGQRTRLRPDLTPEAEIAWMKESREERYRRAAHVHLHCERDCAPADAEARLELLCDWLEAAAGSPGARKSWVLPRDAEDVARAAADVRLFDLAGIELRSDRFTGFPSPDVPWLASLRSEEDGFFQRHASAAAFDCDSSLLAHLDLDGLSPRPLILSTHPNDVYREYFDHLVQLPAWIAQRWPAWKDHVILKYAPRVKSWIELRYAYQLYKVYEKEGGRISFLPQGKQWNWVRAMRLHTGNDCNYLSTGCEEHSQWPPGIDHFLPHLQQPHASEFYGVIGASVEQSHGAVFHRALSLHADDGRTSYFHIPLKAPEIDNCLHLLPQFGFRGLSVTAPLKHAVVESNFVGCELDLPAGNTLAYVKGSFLLYDTDEEGMEAALEEITRAGITPGPAAIFGSGGVSHAVERALRRHGWDPITHARARDGWENLKEEQFTLVVDASGGSDNARISPPRARVWLDLRYRDVPRAPATAELLQTGMAFYRQQALAQRRIWGLQAASDHPILSYRR